MAPEQQTKLEAWLQANPAETDDARVVTLLGVPAPGPPIPHEDFQRFVMSLESWGRIKACQTEPSIPFPVRALCQQGVSVVVDYSSPLVDIGRPEYRESLEPLTKINAPDGAAILLEADMEDVLSLGQVWTVGFAPTVADVTTARISLTRNSIGQDGIRRTAAGYNAAFELWQAYINDTTGTVPQPTADSTKAAFSAAYDNPPAPGA